jgi:hypothetical protein
MKSLRRSKEIDTSGARTFGLIIQLVFTKIRTNLPKAYIVHTTPTYPQIFIFQLKPYLLASIRRELNVKLLQKMLELSKNQS